MSSGKRRVPEVKVINMFTCSDPISLKQTETWLVLS